MNDTVRVSVGEISPMQAIQDKIKGRIQKDFVDLIPENMWDAMVARAVEELGGTVDQYGRAKKSALVELIEKEIRGATIERIKGRLDEVMSGSMMSTQYSDQVIAGALREVIDKHFDLILKEIQGGMVQTITMLVTNNMRQAIQNGMRF